MCDHDVSSTAGERVRAVPRDRRPVASSPPPGCRSRCSGSRRRSRCPTRRARHLPVRLPAACARRSRRRSTDRRHAVRRPARRRSPTAVPSRRRRCHRVRSSRRRARRRAPVGAQLTRRRPVPRGGALDDEGRGPATVRPVPLPDHRRPAVRVDSDVGVVGVTERAREGSHRGPLAAVGAPDDLDPLVEGQHPLPHTTTVAPWGLIATWGKLAPPPGADSRVAVDQEPPAGRRDAMIRPESRQTATASPRASMATCCPWTPKSRRGESACPPPHVPSVARTAATIRHPEAVSCSHTATASPVGLEATAGSSPETVVLEIASGVVQPGAAEAGAARARASTAVQVSVVRIMRP